MELLGVGWLVVDWRRTKMGEASPVAKAEGGGYGYWQGSSPPAANEQGVDLGSAEIDKSDSR